MALAELRTDQDGQVGVKWHYSLEVLSTYHRGTYESIGQTYGFLMGVIHQRQLGTPGGTREVYLTDPAKTAGDANLTEVQVILK